VGITPLQQSSHAQYFSELEAMSGSSLPSASSGWTDLISLSLSLMRASYTDILHLKRPLQFCNSFSPHCMRHGLARRMWTFGRVMACVNVAWRGFVCA
jgi:hypothetical protein